MWLISYPMTYIDVLFHLSMLIFCCDDSMSPKQIVAMSKWRPPLYKNIASYCFLELIKIQPLSNLEVHQFLWLIAKNICHDSWLSNLHLLFSHSLKVYQLWSSTCQLWLSIMIHINDRDFPSNLLKDLFLRLFLVWMNQFPLFFLRFGVKVFRFVFGVSPLIVSILKRLLDRDRHHRSFDMVACWYAAPGFTTP